MGNMATIGQQNLSNYKHIVINNGAHDSVGAQPTDAHDLEKFKLTELAKACGYKMVRMLGGQIVTQWLVHVSFISVTEVLVTQWKVHVSFISVTEVLMTVVIACVLHLCD